MRMTILHRLILLVLLAAIPVAVLQALSVRAEERQQREEIALIASRTAQRASAEQRRVVDGARQLLSALAQLPAVLDRDAERCSLILRRFQSQFPIYTAIGVSGPAGRVWCSSATAGTIVSDRPYFRRAIATRQFTTGGYVVGRLAGRRTLNFSLPFDDSDGQLAGVLIAALDLDRLAADLSKAQLPPATRLMIAGPDRRVLVDLPSAASVGMRLPHEFNGPFSADRLGTMEARWLDGSARLVAYVPPSADPDMPFLIAVGIDRMLAMSAVNKRAYQDSAVLLVTVAAALLLAWWFATRFVRVPMRRLASTVRAWREGDATARVGPLDAGSEFDDLGQAFDAMADAVQERQRRLRDALESTTDSVLMLDAEWIVTFVNDRAQMRLHGRDLLGRDLRAVFPDADNHMASAAIRSAMQQRQPVSVEFEYKPLAAWLEANAFPSQEGGLTLFIRDVTEQHRARDKLRHLALTDTLTGLSNRVHAMEIAARKAEAGQLSAMILLDLDGFKHVNDSFGHLAGDEILREVARRLSACVEGSGMVARLGGDEFVALLFDLPEDRSIRLGHELLEHVERDAFLVRGRPHQITSSCGLVLAGSYPGGAIEDMLANADLALYRAKEAGGGTCRIFSAADREAYEADRRLEDEVACAARNAEFELFYQPQVRLSDGATVGAEALLRWRHPRRGLLAPAAFIDMLARGRHARAMGEWILDEACREAAMWWRSGKRLRVGVNIFAEQIITGDLVGVVQRTLRRHGLPGEALEIELTENIALAAEDSVTQALLTLRMLGVRLAFDDFGTGFASLTTLKDIPVHRLKIDRGFVAQILHNEHDQAIVEAVLALARTLSLEVIAEGVETAQQADYLRSRGCQEAQGFHYARPMSAERFRAYIAAPQLRALAG